MRRVLLIWVGAGFVVNFLWEMFQRSLYGGYVGFGRHWRDCLAASLADVVLLVGLFGFMAAAGGRWHWFDRGSAPLGALVVAGFTLAVAIELRALELEKWSYTPAMPLVPGLGIGWLPALQMALIPLALALSSRRYAADRRRAGSEAEPWS